MLVRELMTYPPMMATPWLLWVDATHLMKSQGIRRLPVLNVLKEEVLVKIISNLCDAIPSKLSHISSGEASNHLTALSVADVMRRNVLTTTAKSDAKDAESLTLSHQIGAWPVVNQPRQIIEMPTVNDVLRDYAHISEAM